MLFCPPCGLQPRPPRGSVPEDCPLTRQGGVVFLLPESLYFLICYLNPPAALLAVPPRLRRRPHTGALNHRRLLLDFRCRALFTEALPIEGKGSLGRGLLSSRFTLRGPGRSSRRFCRGALRVRAQLAVQSPPTGGARPQAGGFRCGREGGNLNPTGRAAKSPPRHPP